MLKKMVRRHKDHKLHHGLSGSNAALDHTDLEGAEQRKFQDEVRVSLLGGVVLLGPLTLLGEWLIEHTHHRPLGAATFASCAVVFWLSFEISTRLLFSARQRRPQEVQRLKRAIFVVAFLVSAGTFVRAFV